MTDAHATLSSSAPEPDKISDLLRRLSHLAAAEDAVTVGRILHFAGLRGFACLLLVLATLNVVIFMVPFLSLFLGLPMVILAVQMVIGLHAPIFPRVLRRQKIRREPLLHGLKRAIPGMEKIEHYIKPRLTFLLAPLAMRLHALTAMVLAMMITLPIPVVNVPPSIVLILLSIGILQRDGLFVIASYTGTIWCLLLFRSLSHILHTVLN